MRHSVKTAGVALAIALLVVAPRQVEAQTSVWSPVDYVCAEASFNPCVDFELFDNGGGSYSFIVTYVSVLNSQSGYMTAAGLYDYSGGGAWTFENVNLVVPNPTNVNWNAGTDGNCQQLSGGGGVLFEGCVATANGINDGVPLGGQIQFDFTSTTPIAATDFANLGGDLGARVHVQGIDSYKDCSYKLDSPQGLVSTDCYGAVVPEPMTVVLLATGLVGIGAVGFRTRRKEEEEV